MSFLIPPDTPPFDGQQSHSIPAMRNQNGGPPSPFNAYPHQDQPAPADPQPSSFGTDQPPQPLPKVGETRCYWALLSSDLQFIYLDPVLASHLEEQADALVGKSLLSFVHPDEQTSAKQDLGGVLESRTLHGSVTRVRYSRLSRVRRQLGYEGPAPPWTEAEKIALDSNYMAVDIVINWAAEGLVLCFIHAIVDLTPGDNDEQHKTPWTNWCGTPLMSLEQIQLLYRRLLVCIPQTGSMTRVFQILSNLPERHLLISWPPDQGQGAGPTGRDFAKLVEDVQIGTGMPNGNDAKTSCTRRYKALQNMPIMMGGEVESIFIPHGTVIFACHKVRPSSRTATTAQQGMDQIYDPNNYNPQQTQPYYDQNNSFGVPPLSAPPSSAPYNAYIPQPQSQQVSAPYSPSRWTQQVSNLRSASYPPPQGQQWPSQPSPYMDGSGNNTARPMSPNYPYGSAGGGGRDSPSSDIVPPPRRRVSPGSSSRDTYPPGGRSGGNRPVGVLKCSSCKATTSPEWRKGPSGKKELCNACGLRYARSRAKKEGQSLTQRRRKEKGLTTKRDSATPPTSASPSYSAIRRNYDDSFMSTSSAGSGSGGSDIYPHSGHHALDDMTPSPSPPASAVNFVHYAPDPSSSSSSNPSQRQSYANNTSSFYTAPSPLSNPPAVLHPLPRLDGMPYSGSGSSDRGVVSPPLHESGAGAGAGAPASYEREQRERERERERERNRSDLPPTPISAEPRHGSRRSILAHQ